jgi:uncharacterized repeat protein (TIGR03803 family)
MTNRRAPIAPFEIVLTSLLIFTAYSVAQAATLTTLHSFTGAPDGSLPNGGVVLGPGGVLYGTTMYGGIDCGEGCFRSGTVFSLTPPASPGGSWSESIYSFPFLRAGETPQASVTLSRGGAVLYGTTVFGGDCAGIASGGTVFELAPPSAGASWQESVLLSACPESSVDGGPISSPIVGAGGVLYAASIGGAIFSLSPPASAGGQWTESILYTFTGTDVFEPNAVAIGASGALYGTTQHSGAASGPNGTVYSLTPPGTPGGSWTITTLHSFTGSDGDGANPQAGVLIGSGGVLYGTTAFGGTTAGLCSSFDINGCGTVYSLIPPGSAGGGKYTILYRFTGPGNGDGSGPAGGLVGFNGKLYGNTLRGGTGSCSAVDAGCGTIFSLTPPASPGGAWTETVVYSFTGGSDGASPSGSLAFDSNGVLYGTTQAGGASGYGTVFSLTP